jgi:uncharacterized coiled-coil protein SlyX
MDDLQALHERLDEICARADDPAVLPELNDVLSEGYARALLAEAQLMRLEERLLDRITARVPDRRDEVQQLAGEHRTAEETVARLRRRLADAHERFHALGGSPHAA